MTIPISIPKFNTNTKIPQISLLYQLLSVSVTEKEGEKENFGKLRFVFPNKSAESVKSLQSN